MRSSVNFLRTSTSDVDICIITPNEIKVVKCVPKAKVPIVKFWDPTLKLACDINVNNAQALHNTNLIKSYVCLDSRVRPLVMIIKHWAQRRDLNDATCGTLSSYTWTCITLNFLQMRYPPILPVLKFNKKENENELLEVEYKNNESIGKCLNKWEKNWMNWNLCIEEPFNSERNLGNGVNNDSFNKIIQEFRRAVEYLYNVNLELCCEIYDEYEYDEFEYVAGIPFITLEALRKANLDSKKK
ncbi:PolyA RNA polymerase cid13 [Gigaspora margarita]|uniref:PolyA RNA polymerase cid13 n=1 Tax=Gigaspora margarita TaxID=4874 RepID=A0A8H4AEW6_GIGMA|nr:PolyA RNA polymerase cid13 [Gigaspora margarita]